MAAVICGSIAKCINGACDCAGQVCMAPFKLCGACCQGCGQCCEDTCSVLNKCCSASCKVVRKCCSSSFCFYIVITLALNVPAIVLGVMDLPNLLRENANGNEGGPCQGSYWLLILWILSVIHVLASFYMAWAVQQDDSILPQQKGYNYKSGAGRMRHLFCYDGCMALYIVILCGYLVWLSLGASMLLKGDEDQEDYCDDTMANAGIACAIGWAFVVCGSCAICCTLCCGVCT